MTSPPSAAGLWGQESHCSQTGQSVAEPQELWVTGMTTVKSLGMRVEVRGRLTVTTYSSQLSPLHHVGSRESNSGQQAWQQAALPTGLSCQPFQLSSALPILPLYCSKLLRELGVNVHSLSRHTGTHYGLL